MELVRWAERGAELFLRARGVRSQWYDVSGARIHGYDATGGGPLAPVVCMHGLGSSSGAFAATLLSLRPHVQRVIAMDMPGHGLSGTPAWGLDADSIVQILTDVLVQKLDRPAVVLGNSLGGAMALRFALSHPQLVRGLVLMSPAGAYLDNDTLRVLVNHFAVRSPEDVLGLLTRMYHRSPWFGRLIARDLFRSLTRPEMKSLMAGFRLDHQIYPEQLQSLTMPILVLWGRSDDLMPREALEYFRTHLPGHARIEEVDNAGHSPHVEIPRLVARRVIAFLRDLGPE